MACSHASRTVLRVTASAGARLSLCSSCVLPRPKLFRVYTMHSSHFSSCSDVPHKLRPVHENLSAFRILHGNYNGHLSVLDKGGTESFCNSTVHRKDQPPDSLSATSSSNGAASSLSSLEKQLRDQILMTGPLTVHQYMRAVLTHPLEGYYMDRDVIGAQGDFITSPEISQIFGELIGVWVFSEWKKMGAVMPVQLIELGPGRGTLMADVLRVLARLGLSGASLKIHLVERSPAYRALQKQKLCAEPLPPESASDRETETKHNINNVLAEGEVIVAPLMTGLTSTGSAVSWHEHLDCVPQGFSMILANEFFDCLPIHRLVKNKEGQWREILIDVNEGHDNVNKLNNGCNDFSKVVEKEAINECDIDKSTSVRKDMAVIVSKEAEGDKLHFRYVLSRDGTPASTVYAESLEGRDSAEVSPEGAVLMRQIATRLTQYGGALLIIDYGHDGRKGDTFRAFRRHRQQHPLLEPGTADLTADVDFAFLKAHLPDTVLTVGPVSQTFFLKNMGIELRLVHLLQACKDAKQRKNLVLGYKRLLEDLGKTFKMLAMYPSTMKSRLQKFPSPGFHRDYNPDFKQDDGDELPVNYSKIVDQLCKDTE